MPRFKQATIEKWKAEIERIETHQQKPMCEKVNQHGGGVSSLSTEEYLQYVELSNFYIRRAIAAGKAVSGKRETPYRLAALAAVKMSYAEKLDRRLKQIRGANWLRGRLRHALRCNAEMDAKENFVHKKRVNL